MLQSGVYVFDLSQSLAQVGHTTVLLDIHLAWGPIHVVSRDWFWTKCDPLRVMLVTTDN